MIEHEDVASLMEEPPGGHNHGRVAKQHSLAVSTADGTSSHRVDLDGQASEFLADGGWSIASDEGGRQIDAGGMTSHRGVLHPDEHVDVERLWPLVERALGFTYEEIASVYREGRPSNDTRQLRDKIDARLLALSRSGGNMLALAKVFGWAIEPADDGGGPRSKTMERALGRARVAEAA